MGGIKAEKWSYHTDTDGGKIHSQLKREEFSDTLEDIASIEDGFNDRGEIVVKNDYISRLLGDMRAVSHGESNVGAAQGRGVVDAVARHTDNEILFLSYADKAALVGGQGARNYGKTGKEITYLKV